MSVVVVAEKPSVARDIAKALGVTKQRQGFWEGADYCVTWAIGHLVTLAQPHEINPEWKSWRRQILPMLPTEWPLVLNPSTVDQFKVVSRLMTASTTRYVVCATDAGREGELIFRYIYEKSKATCSVKRLWVSSLTQDAILAGFDRLRPQSDFDCLADSAHARSRADWLVGMNLSRAYSLLYHDHFSVGRVQTPTLQILAQREQEISDFQSEDYWELKGQFVSCDKDDHQEPFEAYLYDPKEKRAFRFMGQNAEETCKSFQDKASKGLFAVRSLNEKEHTLNPPQFFDLTDLQRTCNRLFGFSSQKTLDLAQALYERDKVISYPRTDSKYISDDIEKQIQKFLPKLAQEYHEGAHKQTTSRQLSRRYVDSKKMTDHHAIIPTGVKLKVSSGEKWQVYDLICRRFLMAWHDPYRYASSFASIVLVKDSTIEFFARGKRLIDLGWKNLEVASGKKKQDRLLPSYLKKGKNLIGDPFESLKKQTQAPARLTEASLLTAMESAGSKLDDKDLSEAMRERGLGTPATRSRIIETLIGREYLNRKEKTLHVTDKGMKLIHLVDDQVKSPMMTAEWEHQLHLIQNGQQTLAHFTEGIKKLVVDLVSSSFDSPKQQKQIQEGHSVPPSDARELEPSRPRYAAEELKDLLKSRFGFDSFRPYQHDVCRDIVRGHDALLVMPTGAGKSLCYQLPGIALGGPTLVISPLVALMEDQVQKLCMQGFKADCIHRGKGRQGSRDICREYLEGRLDFLYVAPERLGVPGFISLLEKNCPSLVAVDEAHCISQWGHDFRPDYRMLRERLEPLRKAVFVALTATATPQVQKDIAEQLGLREPKWHTHGFRRTNIAIEIVEMSKSHRLDAVRRLISKPENRPAIIYAPTRRQAEEYAAELGHEVALYHAGLAAEKRSRVQEDFLNRRTDVIVATIAFGMGIDKSDVRMVVHMAFPGSLEGYYQEIGRAGRDQRLSRAVMFFSYADFKTHEFFHRKNYPERHELHALLSDIIIGGVERSTLQLTHDPETLDQHLEKLWIHGALRFEGDRVYSTGAPWEKSYESQRQHRLDQLNGVSRYAQSQSGCRMLRLMEHFGDPDAQGQACGICDICDPSSSQAKTMRALTPLERQHIVLLIDKLDRDRYQAVGTLYKTHFQAKGLTRSQFEVYIDLLIRLGYVDTEERVFEKDQKSIPYRVAFLVKSMKSTDLEKIQVPDVMSSRSSSTRKGATRRAPQKKPDFTLDHQEQELFDRLKAWRLKEAKRNRVPPFRILNDRALQEIVSTMPNNEEDLLKVNGIGPSKCEKYSQAIFDLLS